MTTELDATAPVTLEEQLAAEGPSLLEAFNTIYEDSTLLIARIHSDRRDATRARATGITTTTLQAEVAVDDGPWEAVSLTFDEPMTSYDQVTSMLMTLLVTARQRSGEPGLTSGERILAEMKGIQTRLTTVSAVEDVHPHLRKVTFKGGDLADFSPLGPDTFLYVLLPPRGRTELTIDQTFTWEAYRAMDPAEQPVGAYYTLRDWRPLELELDVLMVLHGDEGSGSEWAGRAQVGDAVALWGPREAFTPPADTDAYLLVADDTGLPAVARILECLPAGVPVQVVAEVDSLAEHQELPARAGTTVTWIHRDGAAPGTTTGLVDAVVALGPVSPTTYAWGGAESRTVTNVRKHLRRTIGLDRAHVAMVGYWRHPSTPLDDTTRDEDD